MALLLGLAGAAGGDGQLDSNASFRVAVNDLIESQSQTFPEEATAEGDHRFDDRSAAGINAAIQQAKSWKAKFGAIVPTTLSAANQVDREWIIANCDRQLLFNEQLQTYKTPSTYLPTAAIYALIEHDYAPSLDRMRSVTAREKAWLRNFAYARQNLQPERTPKEAIPNSLRASQVFFRTQLPATFANVPDGPDKQAFNAANDALLDGLTDYETWLRHDFAPWAKGQFAIGPDAYRRMLADLAMVDTPLDRLEQMGVEELARLEFQWYAEQDRIAKSPELYPPEWISEEDAIAEVTRLLSSVRGFVVANHIVPILSDAMPIVTETPEFKRAAGGLVGTDTPGPLAHGGKTYLYLTFPPDAVPMIQKEHLSRMPGMSITTIHEAFPGHFVQSMYLHANPDLVRTIYGSPATSEQMGLLLRADDAR